jgi:chloramphenicol-sensitive protein RarD
VARGQGALAQARVERMSEAAKGIWAMIAACLVWGTAPLYFKLLAHLPALDVVAQRTLWSALTFLALLAVQGRLRDLRHAMTSPRAVMVIGFAALLISFNWTLFILSIGWGRVTEVSLGYYLYPLVAVLIGVLAFGERLSRVQGAAVLLAGLAVALLTAGLGAAPWIAMALATSFGLYGLLKKRMVVGAVVSVTAEVLILTPVALAILGLHTAQGQGVTLLSWTDWGLLALSGALTATPLILFSYATTRVRMATVGLVQYLNPTLQFISAVLIFGEPFGPWHATAFGLIWLAVAVYSLAALSQDRAARRASVSAGTDG